MNRPTRERIEALLEMHHRVTMPDDNEEPYETCDSLGCLVPWPCETYELATLALEADTLERENVEFRLWREVTGKGRGCQCIDGDGEEWCVGTCIAKAEADTLRTEIARLEAMQVVK